ncbi:MAG: glycerate kinase, partial [Tepidisphaeraceae bacterium]
MKVVLAPDKFKGCLSAAEVAAAMASGLRRVDPSFAIDLCPVADGGEGTVAALVAATGGRLETRRVTGPLPDMQVDATFGILGEGSREGSGFGVQGSANAPTASGAHASSSLNPEPRTLNPPEPLTPNPLVAVIEMSAASGLALLAPLDRDPMRTTTYGTGQLLLEAARLGAQTIILGIGGSATVDGGIGCAQAAGLPVILEDQGPADPHEPLVGEDLRRVVLVKHGRGSPLDRINITVACDVTNPLFGFTGAAKIF